MNSDTEINRILVRLLDVTTDVTTGRGKKSVKHLRHAEICVSTGHERYLPVLLCNATVWVHLM